MEFRGHLRLPEDAGTGIPVVLRLDDIFVIISSEGDELGAWRADDVVVERIFSNQFAVDLDGEPMVFLAQDALGFAYEGVSAIEDLQERLTKRRVFRRGKKKDKETEPALAAAGDEIEEVLPEPKLTEAPRPIWSPSSAVATTPPPAVPRPMPDYQPVVPEPDLEPDPVPSSRDVRVAYPQPERVAPPPRVETFAPPTPTEETPAAEQPRRRRRHVALEPDPAPQVDAAPGSSVGSEPPTVEAASEQAPKPSAPPPVTEPTPVPAPPPVEPELEIEEVAVAATGAAWDSDTVESEPELEIEEYVVPAAGAADTFDVPDPAGGPTAVDPATSPAANAAPPEIERPPAPEPKPEPATEPVPEREPRIEPTPEPDIAPADAAAVPVASNGHGPMDDLRRDRKRSLFGRSRDRKKAPEHDHQYGEPKTIGGLTRQVCAVCGHVTFSGEDVYQGW